MKMLKNKKKIKKILIFLYPVLGASIFLGTFFSTLGDDSGYQNYNVLNKIDNSFRNKNSAVISNHEAHQDHDLKNAVNSNIYEVAEKTPEPTMVKPTVPEKVEEKNVEEIPKIEPVVVAPKVVEEKNVEEIPKIEPVVVAPKVVEEIPEMVSPPKVEFSDPISSSVGETPEISYQKSFMNYSDGAVNRYNLALQKGPQALAAAQGDGQAMKAKLAPLQTKFKTIFDKYKDKINYDTLNKDESLISQLQNDAELKNFISNDFLTFFKDSGGQDFKSDSEGLWTLFSGPTQRASVLRKLVDLQILLERATIQIDEFASRGLVWRLRLNSVGGFNSIGDYLNPADNPFTGDQIRRNKASVFPRATDPNGFYVRRSVDQIQKNDYPGFTKTDITNSDKTTFGIDQISGIKIYQYTPDAENDNADKNKNYKSIVVNTNQANSAVDQINKIIEKLKLDSKLHLSELAIKGIGESSSQDIQKIQQALKDLPDKQVDKLSLFIESPDTEFLSVLKDKEIQELSLLTTKFSLSSNWKLNPMWFNKVKSTTYLPRFSDMDPSVLQVKNIYFSQLEFEPKNDLKTQVKEINDTLKFYFSKLPEENNLKIFQGPNGSGGVINKLNFAKNPLIRTLNGINFPDGYKISQAFFALNSDAKFHGQKIWDMTMEDLANGNFNVFDTSSPGINFLNFTENDNRVIKNYNKEVGIYVSGNTISREAVLQLSLIGRLNIRSGWNIRYIVVDNDNVKNAFLEDGGILERFPGIDIGQGIGQGKGLKVMTKEVFDAYFTNKTT